jgi:NAD(P)-dependent dehydrogenase (short-subunit alcohol dehydrogenase family)
MSIMNKTVLISGGAQGIGRAIALAFAKVGYAVSIADIHKEAGFEVIRMVREVGGKAIFIHTDVAQEHEVQTR